MAELQLTPEALAYRSRFEGSRWLAACLKRDLSPHETVVAEILGTAFRGIYHVSDAVLRRGDWEADRVEISIHRGLSTYDFDELTRLVVLAHDLCIRVEIYAKARGYLGIVFWPRFGRTGETSRRHATIEAAAEAIRSAGSSRGEEVERG